MVYLTQYFSAFPWFTLPVVLAVPIQKCMCSTGYYDIGAQRGDRRLCQRQVPEANVTACSKPFGDLEYDKTLSCPENSQLCTDAAAEFDPTPAYILLSIVAVTCIAGILRGLTRDTKVLRALNLEEESEEPSLTMDHESKEPSVTTGLRTASLEEETEVLSEPEEKEATDTCAPTVSWCRFPLQQVPSKQPMLQAAWTPRTFASDLFPAPRPATPCLAAGHLCLTPCLAPPPAFGGPSTVITVTVSPVGSPRGYIPVSPTA